MPITEKDSLFESTANVLLTSHAPSGPGATQGIWSILANPGNAQIRSPISLAGGGFISQSGPYLSDCFLGQTVPTNYSQADMRFAADGYAGVAMYAASSIEGRHIWGRFGGHWQLTKTRGGVNYSLAEPSAPFSVNTTYTLRLDRDVNASGHNIFTCYINGVAVATVTDNGTVGGSPFGPMHNGLDCYATDVRWDNFEGGTFGDPPPPPPPPAFTVIWDGNSLTAGYGSSDGTGGTSGPAIFPGGHDPGSVCLASLPLGWAGYNVAIGSQSTQGMIARAATEVDPKIQTAVSGGGKVVLVAWEVGNDLYFGTPLEQAKTNWLNYLSGRRSLGARVVTVGLPDRAGTTQFRTDLAAADAWMRDNWRTFADGYIDLRNDRTLASMQFDGTHYQDAGYARIGLEMLPAVLSAAS